MEVGCHNGEKMATNGDDGSESELTELQAKVKALKKKLKTCKSELHRLQKKLSKTEHQHKNTERYNEDLRKQVNKLSAEIHERKKKEKNRTNAETQTDDYSWTESDYYNYYYGGYYQSGNEPSAAQEDSKCEATLESHKPAEACPDSTESAPESSSVAVEDGTASKSEETNGTSIADMIRATAEEAVSQTGFVFDETSGMYYDHSTGFYYDSTSQLYYDANTGMYYYYDAESGRYQFHSRVDMQPYQATAESNHDKKGKKRKGTEKSSVKDKSLKGETEAGECQGRKLEQKRKKAGRRSRSPDLSEDGEITEERESQKAPQRVGRDRERSRDLSSESEPEEGEIRESDREQDSLSEPSGSDGSGSEGDGPEAFEEAWPPCVRVTVVRSPVMETGTLYIITADTPATIGREKDMDHTIRIPEMGVSKFHAEVRFDQDLQCYVLVDQGSQNGTVINGNRILQPKSKSDPCVLAHGDEVKMGDTVLSFHIHPGSDTCDGCEPGQVFAHLSRHRREEAGGPIMGKEDKEFQRQKELKQMKVKYGLTNSEYDGTKALKNPRYKDRAEERRQVVGSEGTFQREDAPSSVDVEISDANKGRKMLEKMGWKKGEGLGKDGAGMKDPIQLQVRKSQAGLGVNASVSVDDLTLPKSKSKKNWEKARERFADTCRTPSTSVKKDQHKPKSWVKSETNEPSNSI
ncbi:angiogenic factor with G patch and FHA domains 1 isoform X2 [Paramormyrops kingsleyae]|uniref:Angiogenic factor with G patch and FHA domains 1 n=1 Tax=Paramormyrops kingsleyae TaxID=1676925 RepID=A0A3B3TGI5_9TELE|nr:angiogenic factor with G patch and FHA domains 1 isoform X2 [Paramormyrops kingsleyae]XP_023678694.1 angiogenic factor with G patch and FHA domains 1 isoform X2 [Paramormyrops kingsleyae]